MIDRINELDPTTMHKESDTKDKHPLYTSTLRMFTILNNAPSAELSVDQDGLLRLLREQSARIGTLSDSEILGLYGLTELLEDPEDIPDYPDISKAIHKRMTDDKLFRSLQDRKSITTSEVAAYLSRGSRFACDFYAPSFTHDHLADAILRRHVQTLPVRLKDTVKDSPDVVLEGHDYNGWSYVFFGRPGMPNYEDLKPQVIDSAHAKIDEWLEAQQNNAE